MTDSLVHEHAALVDIVRSAATGDEVAFARLVAEHHAPMLRVAFVITDDPEMARDAVQSAWTRAWQHIRSLREPLQVRSWLIAIAANEARKARGRRHREWIVDISQEVDVDTPDEQGEALDLLDLRRVLQTLSVDQRALLALRYVAGLDSSEIARHLGMSASGVRSRLARTLKRIRIDLDIPPETDR
jgi:RNA polymerase sigma factor (sigma-70 family)